MFFLVKPTFADDEVADYERRRYRGWDQRLVHRREEKILRTILRMIDSEPAGPAASVVLDAPCGYGRFSALLLERPVRLVDADLSFAMVKRSVDREDISSVPMGIVCDMTQGLPFRRGAFRFILSMRLFHHLHREEDRRKALLEFAHAAGGWLILSFYRANALHRLQRALRRALKKSKTRIRMSSGRAFRQEAGRAGFEVVRVFPLFRGIHAHHIALLRKA